MTEPGLNADVLVAPTTIGKSCALLKRTPFTALSVAALVLLAGCVHYQPQPVALDQTAQALESRSLTNADLRQFLSTNVGREFPEWPPPAWDFETLNGVAFYYHPSLDVARAQWAVATAGRKTAAGRPNPTAGVAPGYNFNAASGVSPWIPGLSFDWPVETAGKRGKRMTRADFLAQSARLNLTTTAWQVRSSLRMAVIESAGATRRRELLQAQLSAQRTMVNLLEQRLQAGNASAVELSSARLPLVKLQAESADAARVEIESRSRLAEAIGVPARAIETLRIQDQFPASIPILPAPDDARRGALQHRADVLSALSLYEASQSNLQVEIARQYPDLHLGSGYQWDQGENKWNLALTMELPLLNHNEGPIAEAEARRREAAAQLLAVQARVIAESDRAAALARASAGQLVAVERVRQELRERLVQTEARLELGGADQLEVQSARTELSASELALLDTRVKMAQAAGQLEDALQIPFKALAAIEHDRQPPTKKD